MQELPEIGRVHRLITRRSVLLASMSMGCVKASSSLNADIHSFLAALPRETAGRVPFEPQQLEGKVVLITFLATWCFPCLTEMVVLKRLQRDHEEKGFRNVIVGMDLEGRAVLEPFAESYRLTAPVVIADDVIRSGESVFGRIRELPTRLLFARNGKLVVGYSGVSKYEDLERLVASEV